MKKYQIYIYLFFALILLNNCKEQTIAQYPGDSIAPKQVSDVTVTNIAGGAQLAYQLPNEEDLYYVQALYDLPNGTKGITKTSVFSNSMLIKGFGKSQKEPFS